MNDTTKPRRWLARYKWCPDKTCRPLSRMELMEGVDKSGVCLGQLKYATDHVTIGVNDMCFCAKYDKIFTSWHLNYDDLMNLMLLICKALNTRQQPLPAWLLHCLSHIEIRQRLPP